MMAAVLAQLPNSGAASQWFALSRWSGGMLRAEVSANGARSRASEGEVIDLEARRVRVEDASAQRAETRVSAQASDARARVATRAYSEAMAELKIELQREPFMYERARGESGLYLKSAPIKRGILFDELA